MKKDTFKSIKVAHVADILDSGEREQAVLVLKLLEANTRKQAEKASKKLIDFWFKYDI